MEAREAEDAINDFGRDPIGEGKEEQVIYLLLSVVSSAEKNDALKVYNRELKSLLDNGRDNAAPTAEIGEKSPGPIGNGGGKKGRVKLEDLTRFTMVKRIW